MPLVRYRPVRCSTPGTAAANAGGYAPALSVMTRRGVVPLEVMARCGLGIFEIEQMVPRFDAAYGGLFFAPHMLSLAFPEEDFYPFSMLNLRPMPDLKWQRAEISRSYVNRVITCVRKLDISRQEAEIHVRAEMEAEFEEIGRIQYEKQHSKEENLHTK